MPAGAPRDIRDELTKTFATILNDPGTRKRLAAEATEIRTTAQEEFRGYIAQEVAKWTEVAKTAGIHVD